MAWVIKLNFRALCLYLGFLSKFFAVLLWKSESCAKHHRPKGQWGSVKTTLLEGTSKRLFEALLEQISGRNLCPVGFPGCQQRDLLSSRTKGMHRAHWDCHCAMSCTSELADQYPGTGLAKFYHQILQQREKGGNGSRICPQSFPQGTARVSDWFLLPPIMVWAAKTPITHQRMSVYSFIYPSLQLKDNLRLCSSCCISMIEWEGKSEKDDSTDKILSFVEEKYHSESWAKRKWQKSSLSFSPNGFPITGALILPHKASGIWAWWKVLWDLATAKNSDFFPLEIEGKKREKFRQDTAKKICVLLLY